MTDTEFKKLITDLFGFQVKEETENQIIFQVMDGKTASIDKTHLKNIAKRLKKLNSSEGVELYNSKYYEVLVRSERRILVDSDINQTDSVNKLSYRLSSPSDEYTLFILNELAKIDSQEFIRRGGVGYRLRRFFDREDNNDGQQNLFDFQILDLVKYIMPRLETIQVSATNDKTKDEFERLIYSFIFNLSYNSDYTIFPTRFIDEYISVYRINRLRRSRILEVEAPKRLYENELIHHYQKGVASESLDNQFLSFYHVLEYFFEKIYNEEIISKVRSELTKPNFSYKRTRDIKLLIDIIQKKLKYKNDEFLINELEALQLTISKFITDFPAIKCEIDSYDNSLVDYYKNNEVPFSGGNRINFEIAEIEQIVKNMAQRIYKTRNSIVHSKETDKSRYLPFRDDKDLLKEIFLIRVVAEHIIIESSNEL
jgi:hypothetical protein